MLTPSKRVKNTVKRHRENMYLTQFELAIKIGMSPSGLAHIEQGIKNPALKTKRRLSEFFGVPVDVLFPPENEQNGQEPKEDEPPARRLTVPVA